ncbi:MAG: hypothetical protein P4L44_06645 [Oryzomonas sp.]|uniref:hypothetical protein n=1 Tax=Oryzomonas sp. TaxID=2855186 RepID=UPI002851A62F|nr:hypothetical protein [Oryzomonas sp.]MDR3579621.1 hypothetical protein [Oryzomonas sp.]
MKYIYLSIFFIGLFFLCSCGIFYGKQPDGVSEMQSPKPLAVPVGKNWQVIEEAPKLTNERERPSFQSEQSLQPEGATTAPPVDNRKVVPY